MARTPMETKAPDTDVTLVQEKNVNELVEAGQQAGIAQAAVLDSFDVVKAIGQLEVAGFMRQVADKLTAEIAIKVRESKKYKGLPYKDAEGNVRQVADFSEYCEVFLGKSYRRIAELVSNYNQLGPELYEQAEKIGFRQRDYNALKALPADDRQLIAQAIEEENLDKALDLMQEMAAKHHREKAELTKRAEELTHTIEAKDKVIKDKTGVIDRQAEQLALLETKQKSVSAEQRLLDLRSNLQISAAGIKANVMTELRKHVKALYEYAEQTGVSETAFLTTCLIEISRELNILQGEYDLPDTINASPIDPIWAAMAAGAEVVVPGAAEFAARMAQADSE
ncbi:hypothetical protein NP603_13880 [Methylomonas sp. SURF-1]|uniref:DUF3102 domain-containing protein n=1 Tax=Methylomonas aurea TaxID=2952224 RepID=A0ABT1UIY9_9GAMM|nr:hypothetical protein [Methylomonas sp. SURF-1]MCQ8182207.1 hypothetical protein [Methylomonas sp. SURF-1]